MRLNKGQHGALTRALDLETRFDAGIFADDAGSWSRMRALERRGLLRFIDYGMDIDGEHDRELPIWRLTDAGRDLASKLNGEPLTTGSR